MHVKSQVIISYFCSKSSSLRFSWKHHVHYTFIVCYSAIVCNFGILTYFRKACDTCFEISGILKSAADCRPLTIVGRIDRERSKSVANDCNRNARNASDANTLMGSKALKYPSFITVDEYRNEGRGFEIRLLFQGNTLTGNKPAMRNASRVHRRSNCVESIVVCVYSENSNKVETIRSSNPSCTYPISNTGADYCKAALRL